MGVTTSGKMEHTALIWLKSVHRRPDKLDTAPAPWKASAWRTASSSSITWTMDLSGGIAGILPGRGPQREAKDRSTAGIGFHCDLSTVGLDNSAADRQADTHAVTLVGDKGLEELRHQFRCDPGPGVSHADGDHIIIAGCGGGNDKLASLRCLHGLDRISQQIEQHLLNLHLVDKGRDRRPGRIETGHEHLDPWFRPAPRRSLPQ